MSIIGQQGPRVPLRKEWQAPIVVLETLTRFDPPEVIRAEIDSKGRSRVAGG